MNAPTTCRAALLVKHGAPLEIADVQVPSTIEPGAVLVKNLATTICGTDVHVWEGAAMATKNVGRQLPVILGHEMIGSVVELNGDDHDSVGQPLAVGDRIIWTHGFCGQCPECVVEHMPTLCRSRRGYMATGPDQYPYLNGGLAEYGYVYPTSGRIKVPDSLPDAVAAASACALRTIVQAFDRLGPIAERQTVVIQGAGPLGLFAVAKAKAASPERIILLGGPQARLEVARDWGADTTVDVTRLDEDERVALVREQTGGVGADIVIELSGAPAAFGEGMSLLRRGGRYVIVGQLHGREVPFNPSRIVVKQATLIGSVSASVEHYARGLVFLRNNADRFDWTRLITSYRPLDEVNDAMTRMRRFEEIKPAIVF